MMYQDITGYLKTRMRKACKIAGSWSNLASQIPSAKSAKGTIDSSYLRQLATGKMTRISEPLRLRIEAACKLIITEKKEVKPRHTSIVLANGEHSMKTITVNVNGYAVTSDIETMRQLLRLR